MALTNEQITAKLQVFMEKCLSPSAPYVYLKAFANELIELNNEPNGDLLADLDEQALRITNNANRPGTINLALKIHLMSLLRNHYGKDDNGRDVLSIAESSEAIRRAFIKRLKGMTATLENSPSES